MTTWTFLINWRNWTIYTWDTFHTEKGVICFLNYYSWKTFCMLIEIKRNSHIKIRERNRLLTYMCMHGPNFNEMLETKENILSLTYIMKMNSPWNFKTIRRFNYVSPSNEGRHIVLVWFFLLLPLLLLLLSEACPDHNFLVFHIGQLYLVCECMTISRCVAYHNDLCRTLTFDLRAK